MIISRGYSSTDESRIPRRGRIPLRTNALTQDELNAMRARSQSGAASRDQRMIEARQAMMAKHPRVLKTEADVLSLLQEDCPIPGAKKLRKEYLSYF